MDKKPAAPRSELAASPEQTVGISDSEMDDIIARARQTVKPIIIREAANEVVSDDILNFLMKESNKRK